MVRRSVCLFVLLLATVTGLPACSPDGKTQGKGTVADPDPPPKAPTPAGKGG